MAAKRRGVGQAGAARMRYRRGFRLFGATAASVGRAVEGAIRDLRRIYRGFGASESFIPDHLVSGHLEATVRGAIEDAADPLTWSNSTLVRVARHRLGGCQLDQDWWESRTRPRRGVFVLWRWNRMCRAGDTASRPWPCCTPPSSARLTGRRSPRARRCAGDSGAYHAAAARVSSPRPKPGGSRLPAPAGGDWRGRACFRSARRTWRGSTRNAGCRDRMAL